MLIDPEAPDADAEREQRRESDENDVETFQRHLVNDRIVPGQISEPEKTEDENGGENQNAIDQLFLRRKMHENGGDESGLESRHEHRDRDVRLLRAEIDVGKGNGQRGENEQGRADHKVTANVFADVRGA